MLNTNCEFLRPEIMDVLRLFGEEEGEFNHSFVREGNKFINSIERGDTSRVFCDEWQAEDELAFKRCARRSAKLAFYLFLQESTGKSFPWGALTGIRPTKMAYMELKEGRDFAPLFKKFCVSEQNISIIRRVIAAQSDIYNSNRFCGCDVFVSLPFCPTKCEYCSFITAPVACVQKYIPQYVETLVSEIESLKEITGKINSVYIGGGTPFCIDNDYLTRIYAAINALGAVNAEFTVEAGRPDTFTEEKLAACRDAGVNRICVNPQTFSDVTLEKIGRRHTSAQMFKAYEMAQKYGFDINIDLIAGLSGETIADFKNSLSCAISLQPADITVHSLCLKSGSRLKEHTSRIESDGIDGMIALSREMLTAAGYEPYYLYRQKYQAGAGENVGWCKSGKACVYNIDTMEEICSNIAVGSNAISKRVFGEGGRIERLASPKDIPTYLSKADEITKKRTELFSVL